MRIMGIDPGVKFVGVAYYDSNKDSCPMTETLIEEKKFGIGHLTDLAELLTEKVEEFQPEHLFFEDYGYAGKFFNVEVAEFVGIVKYILRCMEYPCRVTFLAPNTVKSLVAGNGNAKKNVVAKAVMEKFGVAAGPTHESDALAIAWVGMKYLEGKLDELEARKLDGRTYQNV